MLYPDHTMPTFHPPPPSQAAQEILKYIQETETTPVELRRRIELMKRIDFRK